MILLQTVKEASPEHYYYCITLCHIRDNVICCCLSALLRKLHFFSPLVNAHDLSVVVRTLCCARLLFVHFPLFISSSSSFYLSLSSSFSLLFSLSSSFSLPTSPVNLHLCPSLSPSHSTSFILQFSLSHFYLHLCPSLSHSLSYCSGQGSIRYSYSG